MTKGKEINGQQPHTLLATNAHLVNPGSLVLFIAIFYGLWIKQHSQCKLCEAEHLQPWTKVANGITVGASCGIFLTQLVRVFSAHFGHAHGHNTLSALHTLLLLTFFAAFSQVVSLIDVFENMCADGFGIRSHVIQWAEWQVSVPFMFYLCITLDCNKLELSAADYITIISSWLAIFCCFATNWGYSNERCRIFLIAGVIFMGAALGLLYRSSKQAYKSASENATVNSGTMLPMQYIQLRVARRKLLAATYLVVILPVYPLVYFLGAFNVLEKDIVSLTILFLNFVGKTLYAVSVMDVHTEILDPNSFHLMAERRANDSRRAFLRYVFHEVRVPLNSISLGLHVMLSSETINDEDRETIAMMREATGFMTETLNYVLSIQKIEEGKLDLQYQKTVVKSMIQTVQMSMKGNLASKEIKLEIHMDPTVPKCILADRFRIEHVLANLLSNAVKFSHKGKTIYILVRTLTPSKPHEITFSVKDEGVGISEENQKSLFTPYMQINPNELQQGKGTGVGLAICKEIVTLHGGKVGINSKMRVEGQDDKGCGSEFFFTIPFEVLPEEPEQAASDTVNSLQDGSVAITKSATLKKTGGLTAEDYAALSKYNILIVDDVASNRKMLNLLLTKKGFKPEMVTDGIEAVEIVKKFPGRFNIIFMDSMMPIMNGLDATMTLRKELAFTQIIIGLTGNALDEDVREFLECGVDLVFAKPMKIAHLERLMQHCLAHGCASPKASKTGGTVRGGPSMLLHVPSFGRSTQACYKLTDLLTYNNRLNYCGDCTCDHFGHCVVAPQ